MAKHAMTHRAEIAVSHAEKILKKLLTKKTAIDLAIENAEYDLYEAKRMLSINQELDVNRTKK